MSGSIKAGFLCVQPSFEKIRKKVGLVLETPEMRGSLSKLSFTYFAYK
ncbi:hypothetical protein CEV31_0239 [Brucella thiophenivorans]|uniref:Uncharacterized protein n=1 Tax=Brucella thiophenivorans TaxID=571255 RepID=A0A256G6N7_9HYPH|nr:hypothetical protein CEV31_0239 [Brucella thiophenivorans]